MRALIVVAIALLMGGCSVTARPALFGAHITLSGGF